MRRQVGIKKMAKKILAMLPFALTKNIAYDRLTKLVIQRHCHSQSNCIDIGAHEGSILAMILAAAPQGKHYVFEPIPELYEQLNLNFGRQVQVYPFALSNQEGASHFNLVLSNPALSGLKKRPYWKTEVDQNITVATNLLDHLIPETTIIDLIKIDVEGAELLVLEGALKTILRCQPLILFECGNMGGQAYDFSAKDAFDLLDLQLKYQIFTLDAWLKNSPSLEFVDFQTHFDQGTEFFFLAKSK